jgi:hypothetical protein
MHPLSILLILMVAVPILFLIIPQIFSDVRKDSGARRWLLVLGGILLAIGATGFFGSALSSVGGLNWLGQKFEWPVGYASGVITTKDSVHIVPHTPSGRIQLYDANWKFLKGWHVDAGGGTFKLFPGESNMVGVVTARGQWRCLYDLRGNLLSKDTYAPASYLSFTGIEHAYFVPTAPWLWVFSHPFYSWGTCALGMVLLGLHAKLKKKRKTKKKRPPQSPSQPALPH